MLAADSGQRIVLCKSYSPNISLYMFILIEPVHSMIRPVLPYLKHYLYVHWIQRYKSFLCYHYAHNSLNVCNLKVSHYVVFEVQVRVCELSKCCLLLLKSKISYKQKSDIYNCYHKYEGMVMHGQEQHARYVMPILFTNT